MSRDSCFLQYLMEVWVLDACLLVYTSHLFLEQNLWEDILFFVAAISALSLLMTRDWGYISLRRGGSLEEVRHFGLAFERYPTAEFWRRVSLFIHELPGFVSP